MKNKNENDGYEIYSPHFFYSVMLLTAVSSVPGK